MNKLLNFTAEGVSEIISGRSAMRYSHLYIPGKIFITHYYFFWRTVIYIVHAFFCTQLRELHSSGFHLMSVPSIQTQTGTHAFSVVVPTLWNSLSEHVKSSSSIVSFSHRLKTHLILHKFPGLLIIVDELCILYK